MVTKKTAKNALSVDNIALQKEKPPVKINTETSQATIPIIGLHEQYGLIETYKGCFVKIYQLGDNNYMTAPEDEQEADYIGWRKLINSFGTDCEFALTINNRSVNQQEFCDSVLIKEVGNEYDKLRKQMNTIILGRMNEGKNGIIKDKYLTVAVHATNAKKAYAVFQRMDKNISKSMQSINSSVQPLPLEETLDILYSIYNDGDDHLVQKMRVIDDDGHVTMKKTFDYNNMRSMGLSINDLLAPSSIQIEKKCLHLGNKLARVLKVSQLPSQLTDEFLTTVTDMNFNCITTVNYKPIPVKKAKAIVARNLSFVRDEKQKALKAGQKAGVYDDSYVDPNVLERESEALALRDAMHERDEKLFDTSLTVIVFAENEQKLNEYSESLITEYKKATVSLTVMTNQQEEGFNSTLPLCYNQIIQKRTLTSSSSAVFIPFSTLEINDDNGINYSCNLISKNLIVYDRLSSPNFNGFVLGTPGCVDRETEFFNGSEWKSIADYEKGETVLQFDTAANEASLVIPQRYIKEKCEKMYHFTADGIDQMLSSEHNVIYYDVDHDGGISDAKKLSAEELAKKKELFTGSFKTDFRYHANALGIDLSDIEIRLMLAVITNGAFCDNNDDNGCIVDLTDAEQKNELFELLKEYGKDFQVFEADNGHTRYAFDAPVRDKVFSPYWYGCNEDQLKLICDHIFKWKGSLKENLCMKTFTFPLKRSEINKNVIMTSDQQTADFLQFAFLASGYGAEVESSAAGDNMYMITVSNFTMISGSKERGFSYTVEEPGDGYKYCFTVPTHALVLRRNGKVFITGNSGKSFTSKVEMLNVFLKTNSDIIIIDPENEYAALAKMLGGEVINIVPGGDVHINPLEIVVDYELEDETNPINAKADFVLKIMECILKSPFGVNSIQETIIDECVHALFDPFVKNGKLREIPPEKMPTLTDLQVMIAKRNEPEARELAMALRLYSGKGSLNTFGFQTNVHTEKRFTVYQIRDIGDRLKNLAMLTILDHIWNRIVENRKIGKNTWFYVDEIYLLFQNEYSAMFLNTLFRRARKYGGVPTGITQNVSPLLESATARDMLQNCCFIEILAQAGPDREKLQQILNLSQAQISYITNSPRGQGLLYTGKNVIPFFSTFPKDNDIYKCLTSDMKEIKAFEEAEKRERSRQGKENKHISTI